eukprot:CAMPEP_0194309914 /NCGR_PEP_ID=MMETSP0171-20130528/6890_1 /TAXON_ID=218684 /ORGANISM="Corethron pennatum, Strain L29A3" /LENGTH=281 /DNA_ID=CAMNT_0039063301 /DNA_START=44 /DNA_END=886 /DNA_ORIENTATION=-
MTAATVPPCHRSVRPWHLVLLLGAAASPLCRGLVPHASHAFFGRRAVSVSRSGRRRPAALSMVFDRMSEPCIASLAATMKECARLGMDMAVEEVALLGVAACPEGAATTLKEYGITEGAVRRTLGGMYEKKSEGPMAGLFATKKANDAELPFAPGMRKALGRAGKEAAGLESETIRSEHLLLSLLDPFYHGKQESFVGAHATLERILPDVDLERFRADLLAGIKKEEGRELVAGISGLAGDTTLAKVCVDLTAQARRGELDPVFGRDDEVGAVLRTLCRRR